MFENFAPLRILKDEMTALAVGLIALLPNLIAGLLAIILTWLFAAIIGRVVRRLLRRSRVRSSLQHALVSLTRIAIWVAGLMITATIVFPNLTPTRLLAGLGLGSIAVGLAFKDIFENFLAGILILIRKPMRIGDDIECEAVSGRVRKRSGELVMVPNSYLYKNPIKVLTDRPIRRIEIVVGVAYGEDVDAARQVIADALQGLPTIDHAERSDVFARAFNSSSIDFVVRWWTGSTPIEEHRSRDEVTAAIKAALDGAGIEIPFPYRTLVFKEPLALAAAAADGPE
jgi:small-conductance mechanosensitive channel